MRILFDNCTSHVLAATLNGFVQHLGHDAVHIRDLPCGPHAADLEWIAFLQHSGDDWLVYTGDIRIQRNRAERQAFRQAGLKGIVLAPAYQTFKVYQQALSAALAMARYRRHHKALQGAVPIRIADHRFRPLTLASSVKAGQPPAARDKQMSQEDDKSHFDLN